MKPTKPQGGTEFSKKTFEFSNLRIEAQKANNENMASYILKVHGETQCPSGISRPTNSSDWENGEIIVPTTSTVSGGEQGAKTITTGDEIWIWTHEHEKFGAGYGLTAHARAASFDQSDGGGRVRIKNVKLLSPFLSFNDFPVGRSGSSAIEKLRNLRHHQAVLLDNGTADEFREVIENTLAKKKYRLVESESAYLSSWAISLKEDKSSILEGFKSRLVERESRPGQRAFRKAMFKIYDGQCIVSGCAVGDALQAAHIIPFSECRPERDDPSNGFLLRADLHLLFDRLLLTINRTNGQVLLSPSIRSSNYSEFEGKIILHKAAPELLEAHNRQFRQAAELTARS